MRVTEMGILRLCFGLDLFEGLTQVGKQIFNVLGTDGKTDGRLCDASVSYTHLTLPTILLV